MQQAERHDLARTTCAAEPRSLTWPPGSPADPPPWRRRSPSADSRSGKRRHGSAHRLRHQRRFRRWGVIRAWEAHVPGRWCARLTTAGRAGAGKQSLHRGRRPGRPCSAGPQGVPQVSLEDPGPRPGDNEGSRYRVGVRRHELPDPPRPAKSQGRPDIHLGSRTSRAPGRPPWSAWATTAAGTGSSWASTSVSPCPTALGVRCRPASSTGSSIQEPPQTNWEAVSG